MINPALTVSVLLQLWSLQSQGYSSVIIQAVTIPAIIALPLGYNQFCDNSRLSIPIIFIIWLNQDPVTIPAWSSPYYILFTYFINIPPSQQVLRCYSATASIQNAYSLFGILKSYQDPLQIFTHTEIIIHTPYKYFFLNRACMSDMELQREIADTVAGTWDTKVIIDNLWISSEPVEISHNESEMDS